MLKINRAHSHQNRKVAKPGQKTLESVTPSLGPAAPLGPKIHRPMGNDMVRTDKNAQSEGNQENYRMSMKRNYRGRPHREVLEQKGTTTEMKTSVEENVTADLSRQMKESATVKITGQVKCSGLRRREEKEHTGRQTINVISQSPPKSALKQHRCHPVWHNPSQAGDGKASPRRHWAQKGQC